MLFPPGAVGQPGVQPVGRPGQARCRSEWGGSWW
jgi:hypothetical protein